MSRAPRAPGRNPGSVQLPSDVVWVLGVDPSLTRSAACLIPPRWNTGDWSRLSFMSYGEEPPERKKLEPREYERARVERMARIVAKLVSFVGAERGEIAGVPVLGFVEGYGFNMGGAGAHSLPEHGGILRREFVRCGVPLVPVQEAAARKLLLGRHVQKNRKLEVQLALGRYGAPFENDDQCDAFATANYGLTEVGLTGLCLA